MQVRFSVLDAVAAHLRYDRDDLKDYRYQPTRTPCQVYSDPRGGSDNYTATKTSRKPRESDDYRFGTWRWKEIPAEGYAAAMGWHIWVDIKDADDE